jgi:hypothetical protein
MKPQPPVHLAIRRWNREHPDVVRGTADHPPYGVRCRVSGGVTGTREAWLKRDGRVAEFETRAEATAEAAARNAEMNGPHRTADFRYWAAPLDGEE